MVWKLARAAAIGSLSLWCSLIFFNPYDQPDVDVMFNTFLFLFCPAGLALVAAWVKRSWLLFAAFVGSLPVNLYLAMTPGIYALFGVTSVLYLMAGIFTVRMRRTHHNEGVVD